MAESSGRGRITLDSLPLRATTPGRRPITVRVCLSGADVGGYTRTGRPKGDLAPSVDTSGVACHAAPAGFVRWRAGEHAEVV
jgi:hypothetical protein